MSSEKKQDIVDKFKKTDINTKISLWTSVEKKLTFEDKLNFLVSIDKEVSKQSENTEKGQSSALGKGTKIKSQVEESIKNDLKNNAEYSQTLERSEYSQYSKLVQVSEEKKEPVKSSLADVDVPIEKKLAVLEWMKNNASEQDQAKATTALEALKAQQEAERAHTPQDVAKTNNTAPSNTQVESASKQQEAPKKVGLLDRMKEWFTPKQQGTSTKENTKQNTEFSGTTKKNEVQPKTTAQTQKTTKLEKSVEPDTKQKRVFLGINFTFENKLFSSNKPKNNSQDLNNAQNAEQNNAQNAEQNNTKNKPPLKRQNGLKNLKANELTI